MVHTYIKRSHHYNGAAVATHEPAERKERGTRSTSSGHFFSFTKQVAASRRTGPETRIVGCISSSQLETTAVANIGEDKAISNKIDMWGMGG